MSTKSFIINLPIITGDQDRRRLQKSFSFGCNLQNAVMGGGWDRVLQMRATAEWQATRAMPKGRERTKAFRDLRVRFRYRAPRSGWRVSARGLIISLPYSMAPVKRSPNSRANWGMAAAHLGVARFQEAVKFMMAR